MYPSTATADVVHHARKLGWTPHDRNKTARKHFYFYHPNGVMLTVSQYKSCENFTVGNQSTSYPAQAKAWLDVAATDAALAIGNKESNNG